MILLRIDNLTLYDFSNWLGDTILANITPITL